MTADAAHSPARVGVLRRYTDFLPVTADTPLISLGEGDTPLVRSPSLEKRTGAGEVWLKYEGANPTGSFKDRGMVMAIAKALEEGAHTTICASTGNTSAAAAAYSARGGIRCVVLVSEQIAAGKMAQAQMYGADVVVLEANFDQRLQLAKDLAGMSSGVVHVNSVNPYRLEGQKTAAFEICDVLGDAPDELYIPVGNAGNIFAYWTGFKAYVDRGRAKSKPVMRGFQAEGAAAIVQGHAIADPRTVASALEIGNPENWTKATGARDESGGSIESVSDEQILEAYRELALEGIFCEPASGAAVAGLLDRARRGLVKSGSSVVCVLTGSGLKDPDRALTQSKPRIEVEAEVESIAGALGW